MEGTPGMGNTLRLEVGGGDGKERVEIRLKWDCWALYIFKIKQIIKISRLVRTNLGSKPDQTT